MIILWVHTSLCEGDVIEERREGGKESEGGREEGKQGRKGRGGMI